MSLDTYPLFKRLVTTQGPTQWDRPLSFRQLERLEAALTTWRDSQAEGGIDNPRFVETKEAISRALENAWKALPRDDAYINTLPDAQRDALDTIPSPNLSNLAGRLKRVEKTPDSPTRTALVEFLKEIAPLGEAYTFLKANTRKRQVKTEAEREAERFMPSPSSSQAVAKVRVVLEEAINRAYQGLVDRFTQDNRRTIQRYLDAQAAALDDPDRNGKTYSPATHYTHKDARGREQVVDPLAVKLLYKVLNSNYEKRGHYTVYKADADTWVASDKEAEQQARLIRDQFLYKNLVKLTPVLEAKGDEALQSVREIGLFDLAGLKGEFEVLFKDGSSFRLRNEVVFVVNSFGTQFHRFPTTFHDVMLPGRVPMPSPSEERMHAVFAPGWKGGIIKDADFESAPSEPVAAPRRRGPGMR
jgi:hypothetical protein